MTRACAIGAVLAMAACGHTATSAGPGSDAPATVAAPHAIDSALPPPPPTPPSPPPTKDTPVDPSTTQVTLKSSSSPTAKVGDLTITLLNVIEVAAPAGDKRTHFHRARLHLEAGTEARDVFVTDQTTVMGYTLTLRSAGDGQDNPHAPRETIAVIDVSRAP